MSYPRKLTPQDRWHKLHLRTVSAKLSRQSYQRFRDECMLCGMTPYSAIKLLCETATAEQLMMLWTRES